MKTLKALGLFGVLSVMLTLGASLSTSAQFNQPSGSLEFGTCDVRLTGTSGSPYTTADLTALTTVYASPTKGGRCGFYDGSATWSVISVAEVAVSVPATTATMYDVFCFLSSGAMACDAALAWTNTTTRATALTTQNSVYVKTGATTRRYMGSFYTGSVSGQTEDSFAKRYIWSYNDRVAKVSRVLEATDTWTYTTAAFRQANNSTANQVDLVIGVTEFPVDVFAQSHYSNNGGAVQVYTSIGEDATTVATGVISSAFGQAAAIGNITHVPARLVKYPVAGRHFYTWLEYSNVGGTTTWYGDNGATLLQSGILAKFEG